MGLLIALLLVSIAPGRAQAQDGGDEPDEVRDVLTLRSVDDDYPVLFHALAPGETVDAEDLRPQLTLSVDERDDTPLVYVAVENTGWSEGTIGIFSDDLDANEDYVALEVRDRGMAGYVVREDGQGLVVPLDYVADLGPDGEPGFRLHLVIGATRTFRIFRVADEGLMLFAQQNMIRDGARAQERTILTVDAEPLFGDVVLECHIEARPVPVPTPDDAPATPAADADGDGVPDASDACPQQWGALPNGCMSDQGASLPHP
jgi:hypothetical protein